MNVMTEGYLLKYQGIIKKGNTSPSIKRFRIDGTYREDVGNVVLVVAEFAEEEGEEHVPAINLDKQQSYVIG